MSSITSLLDYDSSCKLGSTLLMTSDTSSPLHPFLDITRKFGEVVTHKGVVFATSNQKTSNSLQSFGSKKNLRAVGLTKYFLQIPPVWKSTLTGDDICNLALYYYRNPLKLETDLLRFVDTDYRKQYFEDVFSDTYYFTNDGVFGKSPLCSDTVAIFNGGGEIIAFNKDVKVSRKIKDTMSKFPCVNVQVEQPVESARIAHYSIRRNSILAQATFNTIIPKHVVLADGLKFSFESATLGAKCFFTNDSFQIKDYPRVLTKKYRHFFVHSDGEICYNGTQRFNEIGLRRGVWYSINDKTLGYKLARVLDQGFLNLTNGYTKSCRPVNGPSTLLDMVQ